MLYLVQGRPGSSILFLAAMIIGFFHGWMKLHYRSAIVTFAFDIPLTLALLGVIATIPRGVALFPKGPISTGLKFLIATCAVYGLLPFGVPLLVSLAAFRGWCFIPLIFLLGYHLTRSLRQIEMFTFLLIGLGFVTAIYGIRQNPEEIRAMMDADPYVNFRLLGTFYDSSKGLELRAFSTFVSAGAFGGTMAFCCSFAAARVTAPTCSKQERLLLVGLSGTMLYGMIVSGSRTPLAMFAMVMILIGWYRRSLLQLGLPSALIVAIFAVAHALKGGATFERFSSLLDPSALHGRSQIVYGPAWYYLKQFPIGGGLGRSGHGVPAIMAGVTYDWRPVDGDLGSLAVDMGFFGLAVMYGLLIAGGVASVRMLSELRDSDVNVVALPAGCWFMVSAICMPIGSPFLAIPIGPLAWFFLGSLVRLYETHKRGESGGLGAMQDRRAVGSRDTARTKVYGTARRLGTQSTRMSQSQPAVGGWQSGGAGRSMADGAQGRPRFLYRKKVTREPGFKSRTSPERRGEEDRSRRPRF